MTTVNTTGCNQWAFQACAGLGSSTYINNCCQGSCAGSYGACYFCPANGTGGSHCFNLDPVTEAQCLVSSGCSSTSTGNSSTLQPAVNTACEDYADFQDVDGDGCGAYDSNPSWCNSAPSWTNAEGVHAGMACCTCGGGIRCHDDDAFDVGYGGCATYAEGEMNEGWCTIDVACGACNCSCAHECSACAAGQYWDDQNCQSCPTNSDSSPGAFNLSSCTCNAGSTGAYGGPCTQCVAGTYKVSAGSAACSNCPAGKITSTAGSTVCTSCVAGTFALHGSSVCTSCGAGKYGKSVGTSNQDAENDCTDCSAGTFTAAAGLTSCSHCGAGTYAVNGASACTSCGAGKYGKAVVSGTDITGQDEAADCQSCAAGKYGSTVGATSCSHCPSGTSSPVGSTSASDCALSGNHTKDWGSPEHSHCVQPYSWTELLREIKKSTAKTGGLGRLMEIDGYETWQCIRNHSCAPDPQDSWFCFVYHETNKVFTPWGQNARLKLVTPS